ncbi:MAG: hypothetical protein J0H74_04520 [Chitinophagaceae bacterium]|nr:hypothetical protein [Chitinophagaceae bacterium]
MEANTGTSLFELQVDHESTAHLKEAARWAKFLAIVGFIFCGLMVLGALFAGAILANLYSTTMGMGAAGSAIGGGLSVGYILCALLCFFPCLYTYNFARKMQVALRNNDQVQLNQSFRNLKAYYRFTGILMVIALCLWALFFLFAIIGSAFR